MAEIQILSREDRAKREGLARAVAGLVAKREMLQARDAVLVQEIGHAKGRIELREEVEGVLQDLQNIVHERSVGAFERMLSSVVDEVLPQAGESRKIKLDLYNDRNMPALDILVDNKGRLESVMNGNGGALNNVTSTGLRFIALARSGLRRFIILDETDMAIMPDNVPAYFNVVRSLAHDAGIQTILISHHDTSNFSAEFHTLKVGEIASKDAWFASDITSSEVAPNPPQDAEESADFISWIEIENVMAFPKTRFSLSSGVNALIGPNNHGKSIIGRIFEAAFFNEASDDLIRHDATSCTMRFGFSDGRVFEYRRQLKGNPKATYTMHSPESFENPDVAPLHVTKAAKLPDWVQKETGIGRVDDINVQVRHQLKSVFMLDDPASKRAELLSLGRESGFLLTMNEIYREDLRADAELVKRGEAELTTIRVVLEQTGSLAELQEQVDALAQAEHRIDEQVRLLTRGQDLLEKIKAAQDRSASLETAFAAETKAPTPPELRQTRRLMEMIASISSLDAITHAPADIVAPKVPALLPTQNVTRLVSELSRLATIANASPGIAPPSPPELRPTHAIRRLVTDLSNATAQTQAMAHLAAVQPPLLPELKPTQLLASIFSKSEQIREMQSAKVPPVHAAPAMVETASIDRLLKGIRNTQEEMKTAISAHAKAEIDLRDVERQMAEVVEALGNECPTCHGFMDADMLLGKKEAHEHENRPRMSAIR